MIPKVARVQNATEFAFEEKHARARTVIRRQRGHTTHDALLFVQMQNHILANVNNRLRHEQRVTSKSQRGRVQPEKAKRPTTYNQILFDLKLIDQQSFRNGRAINVTEIPRRCQSRVVV